MLFGLAIAVISLSSCGSSAEKDAKDVANLMCESYELMFSGEADEAKEKALEERGKALEKKLKDKYPEGSDAAKELQELIEKEIENCEAIKKFEESFSFSEEDFDDWGDADWEDADWGDEEF